MLVGGHDRRRIAQAGLLVQGHRLIASARHFAGPVAVSLALHAALVAAIAPGGLELPSALREPALQVRLAAASPADTTPPAQPAASFPVRRVEPLLPLPRPARPTYLRSSELDERATPIEMPPLVYPEKAYLNRIPGTVRVRVYISHEGSVDKAEIVTATPSGHFEEAAVEAVRRTRFKPALKHGRRVGSQKVVEVSFDPYGPAPEDKR
jgi:TonB family protein